MPKHNVKTKNKDMKVLLAPMNFATQRVLIVKELQKRGIYARHIQYLDGERPLKFELDKVFSAKNKMDALSYALDEDFDIYHFWQRSLLFERNNTWPTGLDLPFIKARGKKIIHRFTGFDLRLPTKDKTFNPHSPFHHGTFPPFNEKKQLEYIDFLREYVDQFLVQDPELLQFMPEAKIIPRGLNLENWQFVGLDDKADKPPLVVHAPTNKGVKGTPYVLKAVENLKSEGLKFDFKLVQGMSHADARAVYEQADIIIDQLLIGATGVLTLEGWALGKPVIVYLREDLFEPFYGGELPIGNATPDTIEDTLRKMIKDRDWRQDLSKKGRDLVEKHHDIKDVAHQCLELYEDLLDKPAQHPKTALDVQYIMSQYKNYGLKHSLQKIEYAIKKHGPKWFVNILRKIYRLRPKFLR